MRLLTLSLVGFAINYSWTSRLKRFFTLRQKESSPNYKVGDIVVYGGPVATHELKFQCYICERWFDSRETRFVLPIGDKRYRRICNECSGDKYLKRPIDTYDE
jgi:hypothetical protein